MLEAIVRWIKRTRLVCVLLGDLIHREVVARTLPVMRILVAANELTWTEMYVVLEKV